MQPVSGLRMKKAPVPDLRGPELREQLGRQRIRRCRPITVLSRRVSLSTWR